MGTPKGRRISNPIPQKIRKEIWENGGCPYCNSTEIEHQNITKKIRVLGIVKGKEYHCKNCESVNVFTGV